jgi:two-component system NtrC family response regulator
MSAELGVPAVDLAPGDLERLKAYAWPGNVRELKNLMERAVLLGESPARLLPTESPEEDGDAAGYSAGLKLDDVERLHILRVLEAAEGNKSEAARRLGVARKTLERKLRAYDEDRAEG